MATRIRPLDAQQLREQLTETQLLLLERESELQLRRTVLSQQQQMSAPPLDGVHAHIRKQEAQVRALREQLAEFLAAAEEQRGAASKARAHEAQIQELARDLQRARELESAATASLSAQARDIAALHSQLESAHDEIDRLRATITVLSNRHTALTDEVDALRRAREADNAMQNTARAAALEVTDVRAALETVRTEKANLVLELETARKLAAAHAAQSEERRQLLLAMQGDLDAAVAGASAGHARAADKRSSFQGDAGVVAALLANPTSEEDTAGEVEDGIIDSTFVTDDEGGTSPRRPTYMANYAGTLVGLPHHAISSHGGPDAGTKTSDHYTARI